MDEHQQCTYLNPAAERLTGYSLDEVRGRVLHDVIHHTRPDGSPYRLAECPIDRAFPQNMREQGTEVFVHRDGSFYEVAFTASPIRGARWARPSKRATRRWSGRGSESWPGCWRPNVPNDSAPRSPSAASATPPMPPRC